MKVSIKAIELMRDRNLIREYATFLCFKSKLKKSCFYGYTHNKFSSELGLSKSSVRKYIGTFIELGWCRKHGKNLMFNGRKGYRKVGYNKTFELQGKTVKEIIKELYYILLKIKHSQFEKLKSVGRAVKISKNTKRLRRMEDFLEKYKIKKESLPSKNDHLRISVNKIGELFGCSKSKASRVMNSFNKNKVKVIKGKGNRILTKGCWIYRLDCNQYLVA
jgi:predicted transcriptional regulator